MWLGVPFIQSVEEKHVTWRPFSSKVWGRSMWLGGPFIQKCGGRSMWLGRSFIQKCRGEACDLGSIHPKVWWGSKHVTLGLHRKCKGRDTWLGHPKSVWSEEVKSIWEGETYDFGGNEYANRFYTSPFLHFFIAIRSCFLRKQYHKVLPPTCLWKEAILMV